MHADPFVRIHPIARLAGLVIVVDATSKAAAAVAGRHWGLVVPVTNREFSLGTARAALPVMLLCSVVGVVVFGSVLVWAAVRGLLRAWIPAVIIGGSVANLVDRALFGAVHDFFAVGHVVVLNVADVAVVAGLIGLVSTAFRTRPQRDESYLREGVS